MNYDTLAEKTTLEKTIEGLKARNFDAVVVKNKEEALKKIQELIPKGASVMNGSSTTLQQIGYIDYLKEGKHGWVNLHETVLAEKDPAKQAQLRRQSLLSDYYLGSVHAMAQTGEMVIASNSGSQLPHIVYSSPNVIFLVSTKKIVPTLEDARVRLREHVVSLEDARMMEVYKMHTNLNKEFLFHGEATYTGRKILVIFIEENLGF